MVPKLTFQPSLPLNWPKVGEEQVRRFIEVGVSKEPGIEEDEYFNAGMALVHQYQYRLDLAEVGLTQLWLVDYRIPDKFFVEVGKVESYTSVEGCTVCEGIVLPKGLTVVQGQCGLKYKSRSPEQSVALMSDLEDQGIPKEGLIAYLCWGDDLLRECYMDFPGSRSENGNIPNLNLYNDRPKLNANNESNANPKWGSLSRGSICSSFKIFYPTSKHLAYFN